MKRIAGFLLTIVLALAVTGASAYAAEEEDTFTYRFNTDQTTALQNGTGGVKTMKVGNEEITVEISGKEVLFYYERDVSEWCISPDNKKPSVTKVTCAEGITLTSVTFTSMSGDYTYLYQNGVKKNSGYTATWNGKAAPASVYDAAKHTETYTPAAGTGATEFQVSVAGTDAQYYPFITAVTVRYTRLPGTGDPGILVPVCLMAAALAAFLILRKKARI